MKTEKLKNFVRVYLDFNFSLFFLKSKKLLKKHKQLFDQKITGNPLTYRQRISVILDEKRNLVIAGAGTGKTTTILGKILYLIDEKKCKQDEILGLAFSKAAAEELKLRLLSKEIENINVKTIHALGLDIIRSTEGRNPNVTTLNSIKLKAYITNQIKDVSDNNSKFSKLLAKYFSRYLIPAHYDQEFKDDKEFISWHNINNLVTLNGDWVKSYGELSIGNYLYINSIPHIYEDWYKNKKERYQPDFHLNETDIYIEYFGIDNNNNTAPWIDKKKYNKEILWKREIHKKNNTSLIEITYQDFKDDVWEQKLSDKLDEFNIKRKQKTPQEILKRSEEISDGKNYNKFSELIARFLVLFKSRSLSIDKLIEKNGDDKRTLTFLEIFKEIHAIYQSKLEEDDSIDYMDMINFASKYVKDEKYVSDWKYIIIDEFQDTSFAQYKLINNLLVQNEDTKLYCVGDDWQSIYAFGGADYHLMTDYKFYFGVISRIFKNKQATMIDLNETFRFNNMVSYTTEKFIQKNPKQIKKSLIAHQGNITDQKSVFIHWTQSGIKEQINYWIEKYANSKEFNNKNLLILSRYNYQFRGLDKTFRNSVQERWEGNGKVEYMTCHRSKGRENDVVLIVGLSSGFLGFPSNIQDDPVLALVKYVHDEYLHAEERRLLYVAMTRTKYQTHILCDIEAKSIFSEELAQDKYKTEVLYSFNIDSRQCPKCKKGFVSNLTKNENKNPFYRCNRFPVCLHVGYGCQCEELVIRKIDEDKAEIAECTNENCDIEHRICKWCDYGIMKERIRRIDSTPFQCCHTKQCGYIENT